MEKINFLFGLSKYLSSSTPAAPQNSINVTWLSDGENISAYVPSNSGGGGGDGGISVNGDPVPFLFVNGDLVP